MNEEIINRNKNINRGYRKPEVWKEAIELYKFVKDKIRTQNMTPFKVKAQIEDSILSCSSNIAEGYSRRGIKENIQFNTIALASLAENYSQIFALYNGNDIEREWFDKYDNLHYSFENKLIAMNRLLISKIDQMDWKNDYIIREMIAPYGEEN
ncbi:MAG: four helix bundle protein [Ignavibacteria bacterium]|nr:four helix bundle protein [Ignavibacteria bacterium]